MESSFSDLAAIIGDLRAVAVAQQIYTVWEMRRYVRLLSLRSLVTKSGKSTSRRPNRSVHPTTAEARRRMTLESFGFQGERQWSDNDNRHRNT